MRTRKRKPIVPEVADQIRGAILGGKLIPGSKIAQDELAVELRVSRLPIRQALLVLQREGLVLLDHGRGAVVAPLDIKFIADVFDCRATAEGAVASALAVRRDLDVGRLNKIVREGLEAAKRGENRDDLVTQFHVALYEATGNRVLGQIMKPLLDHVLRVLTFVQARGGRGHPDRRSLMATWNEHAEIVSAIVGGKAGLARALARAHIERVKHVTIAFLASSAPAQGRDSGSRGRRRRIPQISLDAYPDLSVMYESRNPIGSSS